VADQELSARAGAHAALCAHPAFGGDAAPIERLPERLRSSWQRLVENAQLVTGGQPCGRCTGRRRRARASKPLLIPSPSGQMPDHIALLRQAAAALARRRRTGGSAGTRGAALVAVGDLHPGPCTRAEPSEWPRRVGEHEVGDHLMGAGIDRELNGHPPRDRPRSVIDLHHYATEPAVDRPSTGADDDQWRRHRVTP